MCSTPRCLFATTSMSAQLFVAISAFALVACVAHARRTPRIKAVRSAVTWQVKRFDELSMPQMYNVLKLRQETFLLGQQWLVPDIDGSDNDFLHVLGHENGSDDLIGYARMAKRGSELTIGRVLIAPSHRGQRLSYALMQIAVDAVRAEHGSGMPIKIGAQAHLQRMYEKLGFVVVSDEYEVYGRSHVDMTLAGPLLQQS